MSDLWPDDIGDSRLTSPVAILRDQASALQAKTGGLIEAEVGTSAISDEMFHNTFTLLVPKLEGFRYELLEVRHGVSFYPLDVLPRSGHNLPNYMEVESEDRFKEVLGTLFGSPETKRLIHSLIAQARAATPSS